MKEQNNKEWEILIALFKSTVEQKSMLIGETQREAKMIFNRWFHEGNKLLKLIENNSDFEYLEDVTGIIENSINELRTVHNKRV